MGTIKTALSIDEGLFERAEALAEELEVSRSRLFALALEQFLRKHEGKKLLDKINSVYAEAGPVSEKEASARRSKHREITEGTW